MDEATRPAVLVVDEATSPAALALAEAEVQVKVQVKVEEAASPRSHKSETGPCARISQKVWCAKARSAPTRDRGPGPRARRPQKVWRATEPVPSSRFRRVHLGGSHNGKLPKAGFHRARARAQHRGARNRPRHPATAFSIR